MSTSFHTAISTGATANAATIETPLGTLDAGILGLTGGATVTNARLIEWAEGEDYELTAITYDSDNVITTATVKWPDGSGGTFTTTTKDTTWLAINAYTITHTVASKTVTQAAVTRNSTGSITTKPAKTVA
jgi:hypothetical protein